MKKLIAMLMVSVVLSGASMASAVLWSENFQGFSDADAISSGADWTVSYRWGNDPPGTTPPDYDEYITDTGGGENVATIGYNGWTRNGNNVSAKADLSGTAAVTGNTSTDLVYSIDIIGQSGVSYANQSFGMLELLGWDSGYSENYEFVRIQSDWNGFKLNGSSVLTHGVPNPFPAGRYIVAMDFTAQTATLQIDTSYGGGTYMTFDDSGGTTSNAYPFRGSGSGVGEDAISAAQVRLATSSTSSRTASIQWDNMVLTPEPATMLLLATGGVLLRRRRR